MVITETVWTATLYVQRRTQHCSLASAIEIVFALYWFVKLCWLLPLLLSGMAAFLLPPFVSPAKICVANDHFTYRNLLLEAILELLYESFLCIFSLASQGHFCVKTDSTIGWRGVGCFWLFIFFPSFCLSGNNSKSFLDFVLLSNLIIELNTAYSLLSKECLCMQRLVNKTAY